MASVPTTSTTSSSSGRTPDTGNWIHGCFIVRVGSDFKTYKEVMQYAMKDEKFGTKTKPDLEKSVKEVLSKTSGDTAALPIYFSKRKCRDSSLGGNDSINPLPQFSLDDDISHPHFYDEVGGNVAMGQVYSENYDDLQQILYLGFGIPVFANVGDFWATAADADLAGFVNKGSGITAEKIGYLIGSAPIRIINIATIPYKFLAAMVDGLQNVPISKYYSFSSQMPMYFRFVNTILVHLATNMNMMGSSDELPTTGSNSSGSSAVGLVNAGTKQTGDLSGMSVVFQQFGLDMAQIMTKRFLYENGSQSIKKRWTDEAIFESSNQNNGEGVTSGTNGDATQSTNPTANDQGDLAEIGGAVSSMARKWSMNFFDNFAAAFKDAIYDGHLFIGFRIDKGMGGSESFSNTTGESQIAQLANEKFQAGRAMSFQTGEGNIGDGAIAGMIEGALKLASGAITGLAGTIGMDPLASAATGAARIDIPEVWTSSSYNRSANFSITCLAPYGDFQSIFQSEYVPLACILAGALPRGTGHSSHSSPFVCQAYCRGVFSSPLCIIENLEIVRGADQFGMNQARLPLKITMHVTLKDLSPVMYMTMGGEGGMLNAIFGTDNNFGEYMLTLSGVGLRDRLSPFRMMRRKTKILLSTLFKNKLSPFMLGMEGGSRFFVSRLVSMVVSAGRNLPGN